jgi:hypothetical protein
MGFKGLMASIKLPHVLALACYPQGVFQNSVSQLPGPGINYTGARGVLLEFVILVF